MSGRRLLAAAGAALFGLLLVATPASAKPTVTWTNPTADDPYLKKPGAITGTVAVAEGEEIQDLSFTLEPETGTDNPENPCMVDLGEENTHIADDKKSFSLDVDFPRNCRYRVTATVTYCQVGVACGLLGVPEEMPPFSFGVAIPPARVTGLNAAYDAATKEVRLTWSPNTEVDLEGYRVERNPPGPGGFETVAGLVTGTTFPDPGIEAEHGYRVVAVRAGPDGRNIEGKASAVVTAGPEPRQPTAPQVGSPTQPRPATSGTAGGNRPSVRKRTATTVDTGFSKNLPFDPSQTTTTQVPTTSTEPEGQAAVLAEFDDDDDDPRGTLVPIAGGLALLMSAVHMRLLSKRVGEDDIPILPGA